MGAFRDNKNSVKKKIVIANNTVCFVFLALIFLYIEIKMIMIA